MKRFVFVLTFVAIATALLLGVPVAHAGEPNNLGCIFVADGGSSNNATTGYGLASPLVAAFDLGTNQPITLQCLAGPCSVAVGNAATDAGRGLWMADKEKITSSLGSLAVTTFRADGGVYTGGIVSVAQASGATSAQLCVFSRNGNE